MSRGPEGVVKARVTRLLRDAGAQVLLTVGSLRGQRGQPDMWVSCRAHGGWRGWIELKAERGRVSGPQWKFLRDCSWNGTPAYALWETRDRTWTIAAPGAEPGSLVVAWEGPAPPDAAGVVRALREADRCSGR